jgi:LPS export ABC transporter protein LptC
MTVALGVLILGCSFDYGPTEGTDTQSIPEVVMTGVDYYQIREGKATLHFQSDRVERFENRGIMRVRGLRFEKFDTDGKRVSASGLANLGEINLNSKDVQLNQSIRLQIPQENLSLETNSLFWTNANRLLSGSPEEPVLLKRSDGTIIQGRGFSGSAKDRTFEFSNGVSGIYRTEKENP